MCCCFLAGDEEDGRLSRQSNTRPMASMPQIELQPPFQPSSTPVSLQYRFMVCNNSFLSCNYFYSCSFCSFTKESLTKSYTVTIFSYFMVMSVVHVILFWLYFIRIFVFIVELAILSSVCYLRHWRTGMRILRWIWGERWMLRYELHFECPKVIKKLMIKNSSFSKDTLVIIC